jgi:nitrogen fixation protein FixH
MTKSSVAIAILLVVIFAAACGSKTGGNVSTGAAGKVIKTVTIENLTVTLFSSTGQLKRGNQEVTLAFADSAGKPVDVGAASLNFRMPAMGSMAEMNDGVTFTTTNTPGVYRGKVNIESGGEWQAQLAFEGPAGKGKTTFSVTAQ